jgi:hypothetical protein
MYIGQHTQRYAHRPRPGDRQGYDAGRDESLPSLLVLPAIAFLLALAIVGLVLYRVTMR